MRKYSIIVILLQSSLLWSTLSGQSTYWVSNDPSDAEIVQFSNLQTAINSAEDGDTLLVYPTGLSYGNNITIDKSLTIEGMGYQFNNFLQPALNIQTANYNATIGTLHILGVENVTIKGLYMGNLIISNALNINLKGSYIQSGYVVNSENAAILNCFIGVGYNGAPNVGQLNLYFLNTTGIIVSNCLFSHYNSNNTFHNLFIDPDCGNAIVKNCIFNDDVYINNTAFNNNIHYLGTIVATNCEITNNVSTSTYNGSPPDNQYNVLSASIFVGLPTQGAYSFDSRYQLLPDSPARDYGVGGVDCGIYDGDFPYRLSGIISRPIVSELVAPTSTYNDEMEITVRVKIID